MWDISLYFLLRHKSLIALLLSSHHLFTSLPQVHLLLWWFAVRYHQNEQQSPVPPPGPHSIITKLPSRRRSVFCKLILYNSLQCCYGSEVWIVNNVKRKKLKNNKVFAPFFSIFLNVFLDLQVSTPSWKSTSLYNWSTPRASSKYMASCPVAPLCVQALFLPLSNWQMLSIQATVCV